jgi:hypothetical protein
MTDLSHRLREIILAGNAFNPVDVPDFGGELLWIGFIYKDGDNFLAIAECNINLSRTPSGTKGLWTYQKQKYACLFNSLLDF